MVSLMKQNIFLHCLKGLTEQVDYVSDMLGTNTTDLRDMTFKVSAMMWYLVPHICLRLAGTDNYKFEEASHYVKLHTPRNCSICTQC